MRPWLKAGLSAGAVFSAMGMAFVTVSLFTDISRSTWVALDNVKGVIGFGFCGVPVSMYVLAYGFLDSVGQYPFEYYDYLHSGAPSVQAYLSSAKGHADVLSTSVGLVPVVVSFAAAVGEAVGFLGGTLGKKFSGASSAAARPNKPLQPTSGADESSLTRRIASAARS